MDDGIGMLKEVITMRKTLLISIILCIFSSSAWSLTIQSGTIEVGGVDTLLYSAKLSNSGDNTELAWVKSVLGIAATDLDAKYSDMSWYLTNQANTYAIDFETYNPEYFLIKIGTGSLGNVSDHFLFRNTTASDWGVVDLAGLGVQSMIGLGRISHIDEFNGGAPAPVSEPATMLLLGSGLFGLAGLRKKMKR